MYTSKQEADFHQPKWLPNVTLQGDPPDHPAEPVSIDEVRGCIRRSRAKSAPSPIDQISYLILKMCPYLQPLLVHLYNLVLQTRVIPQGWRHTHTHTNRQTHTHTHTYTQTDTHADTYMCMHLTLYPYHVLCTVLP